MRTALVTSPAHALLRHPWVVPGTVALCAAGAGFAVEAVRVVRGVRLVNRLQPDPAAAHPARPDGVTG